MFPDLVQSARKQLAGSSVILDGEAVAVNPSTGEYYPFQITVQRKRKYRVAEMAKEFPLFLFVFDLLRLNGKDFTAQPYEVRRAALETLLRRKGRLRPVDRIVARTSGELQHFFDSQVDRGLEGIVAKRLDAPYEAGAEELRLDQTETDLRLLTQAAADLRNGREAVCLRIVGRDEHRADSQSRPSWPIRSPDRPYTHLRAGEGWSGPCLAISPLRWRHSG